jgi:DNA polymerase III subunit gamma/tau
VTEALISKYRPKTFDEVIGQEAVVRSLKAALKTSKTFLFTGASGLGKTTLARLAAESVGCQSRDLLEIDAASKTGIDDMRAATATLMYRPLGDGAVKAVIIDEFHGLSKAAVTSLLKILEEPPPWVYWFLCTTEPTKVPQNIRTRCTAYDLKPVSVQELFDLLDSVAHDEKIADCEDGGAILDLCAREAEGSPRQAIANLTVCAAAEKLAEAKELLRSALDSEEAVNLARALVKGATWEEAQRILNGLKEVNPETVRHIVRAYVSKVVLSSKSEAGAGKGVEILDAFSEPFNSSDGMSPLILACGKLLLS